MLSKPYSVFEIEISSSKTTNSRYDRFFLKMIADESLGYILKISNNKPPRTKTCPAKTKTPNLTEIISHKKMAHLSV